MSFEADEKCLTCSTFGKGLVTYHHLYSRKAYPEYIEEGWNKLPACFTCHTSGYHQKGLNYMSEKYPQVKEWLLKNEWHYDSFFGKWRHWKVRR